MQEKKWEKCVFSTIFVVEKVEGQSYMRAAGKECLTHKIVLL